MDRDKIMADEKTVNLVSDPPIQVSIIDSNGAMSRAWSVWFRDLYRRVAYKGGNSIDDNAINIEYLVEQVALNVEAIAINQEGIQANVEAIQLNAEGIALNVAAIQLNALAIADNLSKIEQNEVDIALNADAIFNLANSLNSHISQTQAHGSNGDVVGFDDLAEEAKVGLVKKMAAISDATNSTVSVVSPDIAAAPALYDQAYMQSVADLTNENKAAINQLVTDLNNAIDTLNDLLTESKNSGQMTP